MDLVAHGSVIGERGETARVESAMSFCVGLARSLGPHYRVGLYRRRPPELIESWGNPRRARQGDPVLGLLAGMSEQVVNEPAGKGARVSVLPLPSANGESGYAVAIEVETVGLARASRLLAS